jgi:hypothetical protein
MNDYIAGQLHRLYREYYSGRLALVDYRYQRGLLLDSLSPDALDSDGMATMSREKIAELDLSPPLEKPAPEKPPKGFRWPYVIAACVPLLALVVYFGTQQMGDPVPFEPMAVSPSTTDSLIEADPEVDEPVEPEVVAAPDVGQRLTEEFVARDDWRGPSLDEFQASWGRLPARDRIVAKGTLWFAPLVDGLEYQITEALEFSSNPASDPRLTGLYQFALNLGVPELAPSRRPPRKGAIAETVLAAAENAPIVSEEEPVTEGDVTEHSAESASVETANTCKASQLDTRRRSCHDLLDSGGDGPTMRVIAAGSLPDGRVVSAPFAISVGEISRSEFETYCEQAGVSCPEDPWPGENMPVVNVSWNDAVAYCEWLSERTGYQYRLPSHTEWEYAARAGSPSDFPFGDDISPAMSRYSGLADYDRPLSMTDTTTRRNKFGLWHVVGNVREWVMPDATAEGESRPVRGGSYSDSEDGLRLSVREALPASHRDLETGYRVLREL